MATMRKPFQGVANVVRFNWHFYAFSLLVMVGSLFASQFVNSSLKMVLFFGCSLAVLATFLSLAATFCVYDLSGFYELKWIKEKDLGGIIVNINAGFDETSELLERKFPQAKLVVFDFYDPAKHTEISIERARKAYPPFPKTQKILTAKLPLEEDSVEIIFLIFAIHEIRDQKERIVFFNELRRILKPNGKIYIVEHLRDFPNFLVYNIGIFHFHSKNTWLKNFQTSGFRINSEIKLTPFVSNFILEKNGTTS